MITNNSLNREIVFSFDVRGCQIYVPDHTSNQVIRFHRGKVRGMVNIDNRYLDIVVYNAKLSSTNDVSEFVKPEMGDYLLYCIRFWGWSNSFNVKFGYLLMENVWYESVVNLAKLVRPISTNLVQTLPVRY